MLFIYVNAWIHGSDGGVGHAGDPWGQQPGKPFLQRALKSSPI